MNDDSENYWKEKFQQRVKDEWASVFILTLLWISAAVQTKSTTQNELKKEFKAQASPITILVDANNKASGKEQVIAVDTIGWKVPKDFSLVPR